MSDPRNEGATDLPPEGVGATENEPKISPDTEAETDDQAECEPDGPPEWVLTPGVSRLAPRWWIKTLVFALVLVGFGAWGLVDALVVYPKRGIADAEHKELEYLRAWSTTSRIDSAGIADPQAELRRLQERTLASGTGQLDPLKREWLLSLRKVARLTPEFTRIENPVERLAQLEREWTTRTPPTPLAAYDIPSQWIFVALGFTLGPWLLVRLVKVSAKKYRWDPDGQRLTIPGGQALAPGDLEDIDKRRWDKFIVFLKVKADHAALPGQEIKVDLYHHDQRLEDWILAMERTAFPDRAKEDEEDAEASDPQEPAELNADAPAEDAGTAGRG